MPWPGIITEAFQLALPNGQYDESEFYGPHNLLLNHLFPMDERYMIVPQCKRRQQPVSIDFKRSLSLITMNIPFSPSKLNLLDLSTIYRAVRRQTSK